MAKRVRVRSYIKKLGKKYKRVKSHTRKKRPKGKKRIKDKKPVKLYAIRDEYGRILGYKSK